MGQTPADGDRDIEYTMRLQRFLARAGVASRRGSENLMTAGRVRVNGQVVTELGSKVVPDRDVVTVDGVECHLADEHAYVMLYKPAGYVTTMSDPQGRPCVASLVPTDRYPGLFPVGRLDTDTTGPSPLHDQRRRGKRHAPPLEPRVEALRGAREGRAEPPPAADAARRREDARRRGGPRQGTAARGG
jgi:ribosome-associated protein YbcJ (S4-like RNA binding protein)